MNLIRIFEENKALFFAARFEDSEIAKTDEDFFFDDLNEFDKAISKWMHSQWLRGFFIKHREDLNRFDSTMSVKMAVDQVKEEGKDIRVELLRLSQGASESDVEMLFLPLDNREADLPRYELQKLKAKVARRKGLIRLYALKYGKSYVITGGAIKLTNQMNRPHLKTELYKLNVAKKILES